MAPQNILRATAHPIRLQILHLLTAEELTQGEIAKRLNVSQGVIGYHLTILKKSFAIKQSGTKVVRGGKATLYRYSPQKSSKSSQKDSKVLIRQIAQELDRRGNYVVSKKQVFSDLEFWVDKQVLERNLKKLYSIGEELHKAAKSSRQKGTVKTSLTIALFQMDDKKK